MKIWSSIRTGIGEERLALLAGAWLLGCDAIAQGGSSVFRAIPAVSAAGFRFLPAGFFGIGIILLPALELEALLGVPMEQGQAALLGFGMASALAGAIRAAIRAIRKNGEEKPWASRLAGSEELNRFVLRIEEFRSPSPPGFLKVRFGCPKDIAKSIGYGFLGAGVGFRWVAMSPILAAQALIRAHRSGAGEEIRSGMAALRNGLEEKAKVRGAKALSRLERESLDEQSPASPDAPRQPPRKA